MSKANSSIQLLCSLCPKNPNFSDISHLLTHVSSKSHLSHRFKLQIRSQSEIAAKQQLDDFDIWYHNNNLDVLLSERMASKEQKKATKEKKSRSANMTVCLHYSEYSHMATTDFSGYTGEEREESWKGNIPYYHSRLSRTDASHASLANKFQCLCIYPRQ